MLLEDLNAIVIGGVAATVIVCQQSAWNCFAHDFHSLINFNVLVEEPRGQRANIIVQRTDILTCRSGQLVKLILYVRTGICGSHCKCLCLKSIEMNQNSKINSILNRKCVQNMTLYEITWLYLSAPASRVRILAAIMLKLLFWKPNFL